MTQLVEFWENMKTNNPVAHIGNVVTAFENPEASSSLKARFLEFCCKCVRRAMEMPETNLTELQETLSEKVKSPEGKEDPILDLFASRLDNLQHDVVVKQRARFEVLEEKVK